MNSGLVSLQSILQSHVNREIIEFHNNTMEALPSPLVTVLVTTYNQANYIADCLDALLAQEASLSWELILGDDASTDGTAEICERYARENPDRIRYFPHHRENNIKVLGKPCGIFQYVYNMLQARGKYIAVCSGDDVWDDVNKLQKQAEFLENNPDYSLVFQNWRERVVHKDGKIELLEIRNSFPKASSAMFLNFNQEIPYPMLHVLQEDAFGWFILKGKGKFHCIEDLKPVLINTPADSLSRSISIPQLVSQRLNLKRAIFKSFKNSAFKDRAYRQYIALLSDILKKKKYKKYRLQGSMRVMYYFAIDGVILYLVNLSLKKLFRKA
ncbi:MAG: glycosyltransferase family 2 protein [Oceanospirillaceae bacterium]|nr:glycosyltransferase family 2 protein [Oceanospirillaceae bacterium]